VEEEAAAESFNSLYSGLAGEYLRLCSEKSSVGLRGILRVGAEALSDGDFIIVKRYARLALGEEEHQIDYIDIFDAKKCVFIDKYNKTKKMHRHGRAKI
jgi:hypothetical protein